MTAKIIELEEKLNCLLPDRRLEKQPSADLLDIATKWSEAIWRVGESLGPLSISLKQREAAINLSHRPVFICGVHRSGTTLVRDLLDGHPALAVLPSEGSYLTNLEPRRHHLSPGEYRAFLGKEWLRRIVNPINQPPYWLLGRSSATGSPYVQFVRSFLAWMALKDEKFDDKNSFRPLLAVIFAYALAFGEITAMQWVDKTPTNERFIKRLWTEMPEARIIHVIRDPEAVLSSRERMEPDLNMRTFLCDMARSLRVACKHSERNGDGRYLLLRYEDLCASPEIAIKKLSEFLGIAMLPCLFQPTVAGRPSAANSSFAKNPPEGRLLTDSEHLSGEVLAAGKKELLAAYVSRPARRLGYPMLDTRFWKRQLLKLGCRLDARSYRLRV